MVRRPVDHLSRDPVHGSVEFSPRDFNEISNFARNVRDLYEIDGRSVTLLDARTLDYVLIGLLACSSSCFSHLLFLVHGNDNGHDHDHQTPGDIIQALDGKPRP